jgi:hypothetical protein
MLGAQYEWAEVHGVSKGLPHGYFADLLGRAAAAGEQLGLAFAALRYAEIWRDTAAEPTGETHRNVAGRAIAEASGLWAVSAGHAAVNVVAASSASTAALRVSTRSSAGPVSRRRSIREDSQTFPSISRR